MKLQVVGISHEYNDEKRLSLPYVILAFSGCFRIIEVVVNKVATLYSWVYQQTTENGHL